MGRRYGAGRLPDRYGQQMSKAVFDRMSAAVKAKGADLVTMGGAVFQFVISEGGPDSKFCLDLKSGTGAASFTEHETPDVTITMADADMVAMAAGKLNGMQAVMAGKLQIKGNMMLAQKIKSIF